MNKLMPAVIGIVAIIIVIASYWSTDVIGKNSYDDAAITMRYAINLAEGQGLVFNEGEKTDAASSFLFTIILTIAYRIGFHNLEIVSFIMNMLSTGAIAAFVFLCGIKLGVYRVIAATVALIATVHGFISGWACFGMDTVPWTALLVVWAYFTFINRRENLSALFTVLVVLMRFEGLLILPVWWISGRMNRRHLIVFALIAIYYTARFQYYGVFLPHAYCAKKIIYYYRSQPWEVIRLWKLYMIPAPIIAIAGCFMQRRLRLLMIYVGISTLSCMVGIASDWGRYTVHLFPLMLIIGFPVMRHKYIAFIICTTLIYQSYHSVEWMRRNAANLAPCQVARLEAGQWLQDNIDRSQWVISSDIGAIAYKAKDCKFIDLTGLTSRDVYEEYKEGGTADRVIADKNPAYIADTFNVINGKIVYNHQISLPGNTANIVKRWEYKPDIIIGIARIL